MSKKKDDRPIFKINGQEVKAGGIIFYRYTDKSIDLLLINSERTIEDIGGCTEKGDIDIYYTVARVVEEESNNQFNKKKIIKRIKHESTEYIISQKSKYIIFILKATKSEEKLKKEDFGNKEIHDDIKRQIKWIPLDFFLKGDIIKNKLNWRLKNAILFNKLKEIKDKKFGKNVFSKFIKSKIIVESSSDEETDSTTSYDSLTSTSADSSEDENNISTIKSNSKIKKVNDIWK
jgi:hypothetical protein